MTHSINIAYLEQLKAENNVSLQDIANISKVPVGTVKRIFAGTSESPNVSAVADIVAALNGSIDDAMGISKPEVQIKIEPTMPKYEPFELALKSSRESFQNAYEKACATHRDQIEGMRKVAAVKDKWLFRMFVYCIAVTISNILIIIFVSK